MKVVDALFPLLVSMLVRNTLVILCSGLAKFVVLNDLVRSWLLVSALRLPSYLTVACSRRGCRHWSFVVCIVAIGRCSGLVSMARLLVLCIVILCLNLWMLSDFRLIVVCSLVQVGPRSRKLWLS